MKKLPLYILFTLLIPLLTGCQDDYTKGYVKPSLEPRFLSVSESNFSSYLPDAFSQDFSVRSYQTSWRFSDVASWISLSPMSGHASAAVTISVSENTDANADRTAIFSLQSAEAGWPFSTTLSVSQAKASPYIEVDTQSIEFGGAAGVNEINVDANCTWTPTTSSTWITADNVQNNGKVKITVSPNSTNNYRTGTVRLTFKNTTYATIEVVQAPAKVTSSDKTLEYDNVASKYELTVEAEAPWTSVTSADWIAVTPDNGEAGSTKVAIEVTPNTSVSERTGYVTIYTDSNQKLQVKIVQKGIYIESEPLIEFKSAEETKELTITSNTSWSLMEKPDWITLSKESGEGSATIQATASENSATTSREGVIRLGQEGLSIDCRINVKQYGKSVTPGVRLLEFSDKAEEQTFTLEADTKWEATISADWFKASPLSGTTTSDITVSVEENTTDVERTGTINYTFADKTTYVNVRQQAKYLKISNNTFEFPSAGGTHLINLSTNTDWHASIEEGADWISLTDMAGNGNAEITMTVAENASVNPRSATVDIDTEHGQSVRFIVNQKPRYLSVSAQSILLFSDGGTSENIKISTDGSYDITTDASWFTINREEGDIFTVYAASNTASQPRTGSIFITLTDLMEGSLSLELSVIQAGTGSSFIIDGYHEDSNWGTIGSGGLSVAITGYTADKNWNRNLGTTLTLTITGYTPDKDWNSNPETSATISSESFPGDADWNE